MRPVLSCGAGLASMSGSAMAMLCAEDTILLLFGAALLTFFATSLGDRERKWINPRAKGLMVGIFFGCLVGEVTSNVLTRYDVDARWLYWLIGLAVCAACYWIALREDLKKGLG
jgi:uncharacterized membrane protein YfcA